MTIAILFAIAVMNSRAVVGTMDAGRPPVSDHSAAMPVAVFAPPDVNDSLVNRICGETDAIWGPAGIAFEWHRVGSENAARGWPLVVVVTIDDGRKAVPAGSQSLLGWIIFTAAGPERAIHLSRASVEDLSLRTPDAASAPIVTHDTLVGRALGRALSPELGHFLLRPKVHTPRGLMTGTWRSTELFASGQTGFELTADERRAIVQHVHEDNTKSSSPFRSETVRSGSTPSSSRG